MSYVEYRAVVTCVEDDCPFCRAPGRDHVQPKVVLSLEAALSHGRAMARSVYGASAHRVSAQSRVVGDWSPAEV